jgi:hypothetical protein
MEKITTKKELLDSLKNIRVFEIKARDSYSEDIMTFKNFKLKETIAKIKHDEEKHIILLDELIALLEQ